MTISSKSIQDGFWNNFTVRDKDIEFLFNHLIEVEEPLTPEELLYALISSVITEEKKRIEKHQQANGATYLPKNQFKTGSPVTFPSLNWKTGIVKNIRPGFNPDLSPFEVIEVEFEDGVIKSFASGYEDHILNQPTSALEDDPTLVPENVIIKHHDLLIDKLNHALEKNKDLVRIAGKWFPLTLLVDVNIGYLNLAEALLDMNNGGPLLTSVILEQIDLPTDVNKKLTSFSLKYALQQDERFDEVGSSGEIFWFLHKLEPTNVTSLPTYLKYDGQNYDYGQIEDMLNQFEQHTLDELEPFDYSEAISQYDSNEEIPVGLIFPHWRCGTLPLNQALKNIFPTAIESPRILFNFIDVNSQDVFNGWVVRSHNYVYGLEDWYRAMGLIPGNIVFISKGKKSGEINVRVEKRKPGREWIKTATLSSNGNVSFTMLKQMVSASYDERMAFFIPDVKSIDGLWQGSNKSKISYENAIITSMLELAKLNPQGQVHAQELYAASNIIKRCPPGLVLNTLIQSDKVIYLGDLYFRVNENKIQENQS